MDDDRKVPVFPISMREAAGTRPRPCLAIGIGASLELRGVATYMRLWPRKRCWGAVICRRAGCWLPPIPTLKVLRPKGRALILIK
jgi:hypothetical protein